MSDPVPPARPADPFDGGVDPVLPPPFGRAPRLGGVLVLFLLMLAGMLVVGGLLQFFFGFVVNAVVTELLIILLPILVLLRHRDRAASLKLERRPALRVLVVALSGVLALAIVLSQVSYWIGLVFPMPEILKASYLSAITARSPEELAVFIFAAALVPGFCEEVAFRGFFQQVFVVRYGVHGGVAAAALAFAVMHVDPWHVVPLFLIGLYLGYLLVWTGSLWIPAAAHFLNNAASLCVVYFLPDSAVASIDEPPPAWALLPALAVLVTAIAWLVSVRSTETAGAAADAGPP
jgi:membrane protease YdiL (CAAX protease family)